MHYAVCLPPHEEFGRPHQFVSTAVEAERSGWDALFVWDHLQFSTDFRGDIFDPWALLAGAAVVTSKLRLGIMVVPLARRRPWVVAKQAVTLDHLTDGRFTLGVGLGYPADAEFGRFGEPTDDATRAGKLDEALAIIDGLWSGEEFSFTGEHFELDRVRFKPRPVQQPRIPIWVGGYWPNRAPFRRASRYDGMFPGRLTVDRRRNWKATSFGHAECEEMLASALAERSPDAPPLDFALGGYTSGVDAAEDRAVAASYERVGVTWWVENLHGFRGSYAEMQTRLRAGPPR